LRQIGRQKFQRDKTLKTGVLSLVHHTHAAATKPLHDAVVQYFLVNYAVQLW
jgi:hypothetical protein